MRKNKNGQARDTIILSYQASDRTATRAQDASKMLAPMPWLAPDPCVLEEPGAALELEAEPDPPLVPVAVPLRELLD